MNSSLKQSAADATYIEPRGLADLLVQFLTPVMIWVMLLSVTLFLLDVRWVYTEVFHNNLRWFGLCFVTLIVALNRLIARDGGDESVLWVGAAILSVGLYILGLQVYGTGSVAPGFMDGPYAVLLHMGIAGAIWVFANRLIRECCIDDNPYAGDVGMLRGAATRLQRALQDARDPNRPRSSFFVSRKKDNSELRNVIQPWEPDQVFTPIRKVESRRPEPTRLPRRHPGVSVLYFSVPVLGVFTLGLPVIQHGGWPMIHSGYFFLVVYCLAALTLLMLTSMGGLREFFRARKTPLPAGLTGFWLAFGSIQILVVLLAAAAIPRPGMPGLAYVPFHQVDEWSSTRSDFQPLPVVVEAAQLDRQYRIIQWLGDGILAGLVLFGGLAAVYSLGLLFLTFLRDTRRHPRWLARFLHWLDAFLERLTRLPTLPMRRAFRRVSREVATSVKYTNPLADPAFAGDTNAVIERSYDALCALAYDLGVPRQEGETPYEYLDRFPRELYGLRREARELTEFLVQSQYAGKHFTERSMDRLRKFWLSYERIRRQVVR